MLVFDYYTSLLLLLRGNKTKELNTSDTPSYLMKDKICISIDRETLLEVKDKLREDLFRNKSHIFEFAIKKLMKDL